MAQRDLYLIHMLQLLRSGPGTKSDSQAEAAQLRAGVPGIPHCFLTASLVNSLVNSVSLTTF